jgi:hypothetical protein
MTPPLGARGPAYDDELTPAEPVQASLLGGGGAKGVGHGEGGRPLPPRILAAQTWRSHFLAPQKLLRRAPGGMPGARIFLGLFPLKRAFFLSFFSQEPFSSESLSGPCRWLRYRELKSTKVPKYSLPIPRGPSCPRARVNVCEFRGGKRSKVSPRGALNLPAARFLQTKRFGKSS